MAKSTKSNHAAGSHKIKNGKDQVNEDLKSALDFKEDKVDKTALLITDAFGSMKFLVMCLVIFLIWLIWNTGNLPGLKPFDPYPFSMLTMIVSLFAIVLSISVLISQNREGKMEKTRTQVEFEVNVRAENEVTKVLEMLHEIQKKLGIHHDADPELEKMKEQIDVKEIHQKLDDSQ